MSNEIYKSYAKEIFYLQKRGNKLLQQINQQETKMNQRKQENLIPHPRSLNKMKRMIIEFLKILAFIETYQYFQMQNEPLSNNNQTWFYEVANQYYEDILQRFLLKLKTLRSVDFVVIRNKTK